MEETVTHYQCARFQVLTVVLNEDLILLEHYAMSTCSDWHFTQVCEPTK